MSVTHTAAIRNTLANAILTAIDADVGAGNLVFQTAGAAADVATLPLTDPAGSVAGAVLTFGTINSDTNAAGGTIAEFKVETNLGTEIFRGSVGTSGQDINLSSLVIAATDTVSVSSLTYTAPV